MYDFEEERVREFLRRTGAKRAAVQLPAGLARFLPGIRRPFDELGVEMVVLAGTCYGACDLADDTARKLGCEVLVHYGHADMGLGSALPTLFVEARIKVDLVDSLRQALPALDFKRAGLVATVQHVGQLEEVVRFLSAQGIEVVLGGPSSRTRYRGQILGCDVGCAKALAPVVDGFVYIGTGDFHPLGVALATGKKVVAVNPVSGGFKVFSPRQEEFLKWRKAVVARAALGKSFGVIVSTKKGQSRFNLGRNIVKLLRQEGRQAHLLAVDDVSPEAVENFNFDALVCVACPRIPIDDAERFERPVLTPFEVLVMLGKAPIEPYQLDEVSLEDRG
ncbi:MAG: diphthamide biosynthesis enzyme Dph2 [Candidatus Hadarchaeum sp.]|uniref:diphthamide biosynthesis enzyme Dph2 n=1 Tax=Candidatus Hadarchaeum sp. TaxID=2883567 RepID=UPI003D1074F1